MSETGKLKTIDFESGKFEANGKVYLIENQISHSRYKYYILYQTEMGFGVSFADMLEQWQGVLTDANKLQFANIVIRATNMLEGIGKFGERKHPALCICALFCNTEDEDRTVFTAPLLERKLADFEKEGIDVCSFFALAATLVSGLTSAWNDMLSIENLPTPEVNKSKRK